MRDCLSEGKLSVPCWAYLDLLGSRWVFKGQKTEFDFWRNIVVLWGREAERSRKGREKWLSTRSRVGVKRRLFRVIGFEWIKGRNSRIFLSKKSRNPPVLAFRGVVGEECGLHAPIGEYTTRPRRLGHLVGGRRVGLVGQVPLRLSQPSASALLAWQDCQVFQGT